MRAFLTTIFLITSVAFLLTQRASRAEVNVRFAEELRKDQEAWRHPVWRAVKLGDKWEQDILDAFLARSASLPSPGQLVFVGFESDDPDEQFAADYPDPESCSFRLIAKPRKELQPKMLRKLTVVIRGPRQDDLDLAFAVVQTNARDDSTAVEGTALLGDLRYGFICTPLGNPLASCDYSLQSLFFPWSGVAKSFRSLTDEQKDHCEMIAAKRRCQLIESRAIVTRQRGKKMPTWGGGNSSAFIVEPAIWYFDPDSRVQKMDCTDGQVVRDSEITAARTKENAPLRRNVAEFAFEDYDDARVVHDLSGWSSWLHGCGLFDTSR